MVAEKEHSYLPYKVAKVRDARCDHKNFKYGNGII